MRKMSWGSESTPTVRGELRCLLDNVQGLVDALTSVRWKKQQVGNSSLKSLIRISCFAHVFVAVDDEGQDTYPFGHERVKVQRIWSPQKRMPLGHIRENLI